VRKATYGYRHRRRNEAKNSEDESKDGSRSEAENPGVVNVWRKGGQYLYHRWR
jgi:hypothetical protein